MSWSIRELRSVPKVTALTRLWGLSRYQLITIASSVGASPKTWTSQGLIDAIIAVTHPPEAQSAERKAQSGEQVEQERMFE